MPDYIKKGIGSRLIKFATKYCKENSIELLNIFSDPNAKGFYENIGAKYISEYESSIENRTVSLYEYTII
jgi:GNAT superfamily N-acetyltransferase